MATESQRLRALGLAREIAHMEVEQILSPSGDLSEVYTSGEVDYTRMTNKATKLYTEHLAIWNKRLTELIEVL